METPIKFSMSTSLDVGRFRIKLFSFQKVKGSCKLVFFGRNFTEIHACIWISLYDSDR